MEDQLAERQPIGVLHAAPMAKCQPRGVLNSVRNYFKEFFFVSVRSFEKGLTERGGWRQVPEIEASFLHPFSYALLGEEEHIS